MSEVLKVLSRVKTGRPTDRPINIRSNFKRPFVWNAKRSKNAKNMPSEVLMATMRKVTDMKNAQQRQG